MAENISNFPRNPSIKRSWIDIHGADEADQASNDGCDCHNALPAIKRCRESSTDQQGTDTGYASSSLSESVRDRHLSGDGDARNGSDSNTGDEGLWFDVKGRKTSPSHAPETPNQPSSSTVKESATPNVSQNGDTNHTVVSNTPDEGNKDPIENGALEDNEDNVSEISGLSDVSLDGDGWRPTAGPMAWVHKQMLSGVNPRSLLRSLLPDCTDIPEDFDDVSLWKIVVQILSEPPKRKKLPDINSLSDVISLIQNCKKIMVLTGAGVSVSCGIPDFRSRDGVYARLAVEYPDLPDPQAMFDIQYFHRNPKPFFKFAKELYPGQFEPSPSHRFIQLIEKHDKLLRNYTQNIDTLEQVAGIHQVLQCHGSFATATCLVCKHKVDAEAIREDIMNQVIPHCPKCSSEDEQAIMKPDIVFFGESLPNEFHRQMDIDKDDCDLLIVMGSSLKVRPVALIPNSLPASVPQILINREPLKHLAFDVELLGDCDVIVKEICRRLGDSWELPGNTQEPLHEISREEMSTPSLASPSHSPMYDTASSTSQKTDTPAERALTNLKPVCSSADSSQSGPDAMLAADKNTYCSFHHVDSSSNLSVTGHLESTHLTSSASTASLPVADSPAASASVPSEESKMEESSKAVPDESSMQDKKMTGSEEGTEMPERSKHTEKELQELRAAWQPRIINLASRLKANTFLFLSPNRYVFHGAEVYDDDDSNDDDDSSASSYSDCHSNGSDKNDGGTSSNASSSPNKESFDLDTSGERHFGVFSTSSSSGGDSPPVNTMAGIVSPPYTYTSPAHSMEPSHHHSFGSECRTHTPDLLSLGGCGNANLSLPPATTPSRDMESCLPEGSALILSACTVVTDPSAMDT